MIGTSVSRSGPNGSSRANSGFVGARIGSEATRTPESCDTSDSVPSAYVSISPAPRTSPSNVS